MNACPPKPHRLANLIPAATEADYRLLHDRIRENGQREPIVLLDGKVLDGRHRLRACIELGAEPVYREFGSSPGDGDDPLAFVFDVNVGRRQMNTTQKAKTAANLVDEWGSFGGRTSAFAELPGRGRSTYSKAASLFGVSEHSVYCALRLKRNAPDLFEMLDGEILKLGHARALLRAREKRGQAPQPGHKQRAPVVKESDRREQQRRALSLLTAANAAVVEADEGREDLIAAIRAIKHHDDVIKLAMNVGWSVRYMRRIEAELRAHLTQDEARRVDSAYAQSDSPDGPGLRAIRGGRA